MQRFLMTLIQSSGRKLEVKQKTQDIINNNVIAVFSKSRCPYCIETKDLLKELGASFYLIELDQIDDGPAIQQALKEINGQSTVPNIYIQKKHIGGNSDLQAMKSQLPALLREVGALSNN